MIAIGEIGLDYYYSADNKAEQQAVFGSQIDIANQLDKPVIIHTRSAGDDTIAMLREHHAEKCGGVIHCFTETMEFAKKALDLGFTFLVLALSPLKMPKRFVRLFVMYQWNAYWWRRIRLILRLCLTEEKKTNQRIREKYVNTWQP